MRLELQVRREDVALMRRVAAALSDPGEATRTRRLLEAQFPVDGQPDLKALLAATAAVHDLVLVTRNTCDVDGLGVRVLDPFAP